MESYVVITEDINSINITDYISNYIEEVYGNQSVTTTEFELYSRGKHKHTGFYFKAGSGDVLSLMKDVLTRFKCDNYKFK